MKDTKKVIIPDEFVGRLYSQYDSITRNFRFVFGGTVVFGLLFYSLVFSPAMEVYIERESISHKLGLVQDTIRNVEEAIESTQALEKLLNRMDDDLAKGAYKLRKYLIDEGFMHNGGANVGQYVEEDSGFEDFGDDNSGFDDFGDDDFTPPRPASFNNKKISTWERKEAETRRRPAGVSGGNRSPDLAVSSSNKGQKITAQQSLDSYLQQDWKQEIKANPPKQKPMTEPSEGNSVAIPEKCEDHDAFEKIYLCKVESYLNGYFRVYADGLQEALAGLQSDSRIPREEIEVLKNEFLKIEKYAIESLREEKQRVLSSFNSKERLFVGIRETIKTIIPEKAPVFNQLKANSAQEVKSLNAYKKVLEEETETLAAKEKEIKQRMSQITIPVINVTAEIFGSTEIFPLLMTIGFIISIYLYTEKLRIRQSFINKYLGHKYKDLDRKDFRLTLPIWMDPSIPLRKQIFKLGYLLMPLFVFISVIGTNLRCLVMVGTLHDGLISAAFSVLILVFCAASYVLGYTWLFKYYRF